MKASLHKIFGNLAIISAIAFAPVAADAADFDVETYYKSLNGKCGKALMEAIKDLCIDHTELSYSGGTWNAFKETDVREHLAITKIHELHLADDSNYLIADIPLRELIAHRSLFDRPDIFIANIPPFFIDRD